MSSRMKGRVKWFNNRKEFGFIERDEGPDVFVHYRDIEGEGFRTLTEGQSVLFTLDEREKGPAALAVTADD